MLRRLLAVAVPTLVLAACSDGPTIPNAARPGPNLSRSDVASATTRTCTGNTCSNAIASETSVSVTVSGPSLSSVVRVNNTVRSFTANPSGGDGTYTYQWRVVRPDGWISELGTEQTQSVLFTCLDQGNNRIEVTVSSAGQQGSGARYQFVDIPASGCPQ